MICDVLVLIPLLVDVPLWEQTPIWCDDLD